MLMTEKKATETFCPITFVLGHANSTRTPDQQDGPATCVGPSCMAWRWVRYSLDRGSRGYCGLAGIPNDQGD